MRAYLPAITFIFLYLNASLMAEPTKSTQPTSGTVAYERGWKYDQGVGVPIDMNEAIRDYREAAEQGSALAKGRLAVIYFSGNGVAPNKADAAGLAKGILPDIEKAAERIDSHVHRVSASRDRRSGD